MNCLIATLSSINMNNFFFSIVPHYSLLTQFEMLTISPFNNKLVKRISHANENRVPCYSIRKCWINVNIFEMKSVCIKKHLSFSLTLNCWKSKLFSNGAFFIVSAIWDCFFFSTKENVPQLNSVLYTLFFFLYSRRPFIWNTLKDEATK